MMYSKNGRNTGSALILGMLVVLIISALVITHSRISQSNFENTESFAVHQKAHYAAQSGLARAQNILSQVTNDGAFDDYYVPMEIDESISFSGSISDSNYYVTITRKSDIELVDSTFVVEPITGDQFTIHSGQVIVDRTYSARVKFIGAEIQSGDTPLAVTTKIKVGSRSVEPFGDFKTTAGNVNDGEYHPDFLIQGVAHDSPLSMKGRSFNKSGEQLMLVNSITNKNNSLVLRNGDTPPLFDPAFDQATIASLLVDYIDELTGVIVLEENEVIFLMELGTTDKSSWAYDMQDLVVVVSFETAKDVTPIDCSYGKYPDTPGDTTTTTTEVPTIFGMFEVVSTGYVGQLENTEDRHTVIGAVAHAMGKQKKRIFHHEYDNFGDISVRDEEGELVDVDTVKVVLKSRRDATDTQEEEDNIAWALEDADEPIQ